MNTPNFSELDEETKRSLLARFRFLRLNKQKDNSMNSKPKFYDTAYPGSMSEREGGSFVDRTDSVSLASALLLNLADAESKAADWMEDAIRWEGQYQNEKILREKAEAERDRLQAARDGMKQALDAPVVQIRLAIQCLDSVDAFLHDAGFSEEDQPRHYLLMAAKNLKDAMLGTSPDTQAQENGGPGWAGLDQVQMP